MQGHKLLPAKGYGNMTVGGFLHEQTYALFLNIISYNVRILIRNLVRHLQEVNDVVILQWYSF